MKTYYLTTPLYYVNAKPHIGHAYTNVLCDTFSRFRKFYGEDVFFLTGTDEHGTKIEKIAKDQGKQPREFVDAMVPPFVSLWKLLGIEYDDFIRTTEERHKKVVASVLQLLEKKGDIYKSTYTGWYCTPCESFWTDLQLKEEKCPDCSREVQQLSEDNYFFKLSKYQAWLIEYIHQHPDFILPEMRRNEILGFLKEPLEDLSITRPRTRLVWGIDYPGSKEHVVYVWFDALINYISAAGYSTETTKFKELWPANLHVVGKDILRQHAVYWPIMLKSLELEMPQTILAHGWWTMSGAKVSKSRGNAVDPVELVGKYGVDAFRFFLLNEVTVGQDGAFSEDLLAERYTTRLANDLGNLWFRLAAMMDKYFGGSIPNEGHLTRKEPLFVKSIDLYDIVKKSMMQFDPRSALGAIGSVLTEANQFVEQQKPWALAKDPANREVLANVLKTLAESTAHVSALLLIFLPETAAKILSRLGIDYSKPFSDEKKFKELWLQPGARVEKGDVLFPRLDDVEGDVSLKKK